MATHRSLPLPPLIFPHTRKPCIESGYYYFYSNAGYGNQSQCVIVAPPSILLPGYITIWRDDACDMGDRLLKHGEGCARVCARACV